MTHAEGVVAVILAALALFAAFVFGMGARRRRARKEPLSDSMRAVLAERVEFYRRLDAGERARFEHEVAVFLADQTITGPRAAEVSERLRALVAASAVILIFGRPGLRYPRLRDVVVYEGAFDEQYQEGSGKPILGMVHAQGPILLSAEHLEDGFARPRDGMNVGLHELAHVLDFEAGHADGVPALLPWRSTAAWLEVVHAEMQRAGTRGSVLRRYAATNEAELFAVATEAFFERPRELEQKHPELYAFLLETYGREPPR